MWVRMVDPRMVRTSHETCCVLHQANVNVLQYHSSHRRCQNVPSAAGCEEVHSSRVSVRRIRAKERYLFHHFLCLWAVDAISGFGHILQPQGTPSNELSARENSQLGPEEAKTGLWDGRETNEQMDVNAVLLFT